MNMKRNLNYFPNTMPFLLTTLNGLRCHLERHVLTSWLGNVNTEHQSHTGILPPDVCLTFPQLNIRVPELQNPSAVNSRTESSIVINWYQNRCENDMRFHSCCKHAVNINHPHTGTETFQEAAAHVDGVSKKKHFLACINTDEGDPVSLFSCSDIHLILVKEDHRFFIAFCI